MRTSVGVGARRLARSVPAGPPPAAAGRRRRHEHLSARRCKRAALQVKMPPRPKKSPDQGAKLRKMQAGGETSAAPVQDIAFETRRASELQGTSGMPPSLASLSVRCAALLKGRKQTVSVMEATTGGLINASLLSVPGASAYYIGGTSVYSGPAARGLFPHHVQVESGMFQRGNYRSEDTYVASKVTFVANVARAMKEQMGTDWCVAESGATGPTVLGGKMHDAFTAVCVSGPPGERTIVVRADPENREKNMWQFCATAIDFLEECLLDSEPGAAVSSRL